MTNRYGTENACNLHNKAHCPRCLEHLRLCAEGEGGRARLCIEGYGNAATAAYFAREAARYAAAFLELAGK